jgi:hypothetical protein
MDFFKNKKKNKMLLIFGPQGSGNHLFSKIFALHPDVHGWEELLDNSDPDNYFVPHYKEPNNKYWDDIDGITLDIMGGKNYSVISASIPFWNKDELQISPVNKLIAKLQSLNIEIQVVIIGRDKTILTNQQTRMRGGPTWGCMTQLIRWLDVTPFYVSTELFYLYGKAYVRDIGKWLDFPVAYNDPRLNDIMIEDSNEKYIHQASNLKVDDIVKRTGYPVAVQKKEIF